MEGDWRALPDFEELEAKKTGIVTNVGLEAVDGSREQRWALQLNGYLDVPDDGMYTFFLISDDGARLWLDGAMVIDNDGIHGVRT